MTGPSIWMTFIIAFTGIATVVAYLVAMVIATQRWRDFPRPSKFLLAGLALSVLSYAASATFSMAVARFASPNVLASAMVMVNLGRMALHLISLGLIVCAVYVDRKVPQRSSSEEFLPGDERAATIDANPFAHVETRSETL